MCYVSCQAQQKSPFLGFNLTSNSWWNPRRWARWQPLLVSFREDKRLSTENKIVSQYCHKMKTLGGGVSISLPPTLYHDRGLNLRVRQRSGKNATISVHIFFWHFWATNNNFVVASNENSIANVFSLPLFSNLTWRSRGNRLGLLLCTCTKSNDFVR